MHRTSTCKTTASVKPTPWSSIEALVTPEPSIRTSSRKQVWILTALVFGMRLDGMVLCPLRRMVLVSSPSSFFALFGRWTMVFLSNFLEINAILIGEISVTSLVLARACQFPLQKLAAVLINMSFGVWFRVKVFMAMKRTDKTNRHWLNSHLKERCN